MYAPYLDLKTNQTAPDLQTFSNFVQVINQPSSSTFSDADFIAALSQYIDPKSFLSYVATEQVLSAEDGMVGGVVGMNNFDLYQFQGTTFYQVIPWDKGTTFSDWTKDIMYGITLPININLLAQRLVGIPEYLNFYLGQVSKAANLLGGTGGWADNLVTFEYGVIDAAASNDPNKQCMNYGVLYPCGTADFQDGVLHLHEYMADRCSYVMPDLQADGYQPVTTDPQITSAAMAAPSSPQNAAAVIATPVGQAVPGSLLTLTGANLGPASQASGDSLPRSLASTFVSVDGVRAPLVTTSAGQIELQIPWDLPAGSANVVVSVAGEMSNTLMVSMQATMPTILAIVHQSDGNPVSNAEPATAGEILVAYMAGLGDLSTDLSFGAAAPASPLAATAVTPQVTLGDTPAYVISSGLSPGFFGLYQVTAVLPATLPQGGLANLTITAGSSATSTSLALAAQ